MQDDFVSMRQEEQGLTVEEQSTMYIDWSIVNRSINTIVNFSEDGIILPLLLQMF